MNSIEREKKKSRLEYAVFYLEHTGKKGMSDEEYEELYKELKAEKAVPYDCYTPEGYKNS